MRVPSATLALVATEAAVLERELYSEAEAARLLRIPHSTLHYWLQGGVRRGVTYAPILRAEPLERRWVTWAEFIEAGWLGEYRRARQVPMNDLRDFITRLRDEMGVPYPLAHHRPFVSGKKLVLRAQEGSGLSSDFHLVTETADGQMMLTPPGYSFVQRVVWEGDLATGWKPHEDHRSTVRVFPHVRFGRPSVAGVSTRAIFDESEAGASTQELAEDFEISAADVRWAIAYENSVAA
jgi:uncharacterized protein (DUF433 family)